MDLILKALSPRLYAAKRRNLKLCLSTLVSRELSLNGTSAIFHLCYSFVKVNVLNWRGSLGLMLHFGGTTLGRMIDSETLYWSFKFEACGLFRSRDK